MSACDWIAGVGNDPPAATTAIQDRIVAVDDTVVVDLGRHFSDPNGDALSYTAVSSAPATAAVAVRGSLLTLRGVAAGRAAITVTASDPEGLSDVQSFEATVPNRAPEPLGAVPDAEVYVDSTLVIDAAAYFADPDGDDLEYAVVSSDTTRVAIVLSGSEVTLTGVAVGRAAVTFTARDPDGLEAEQTFAVTVPNRAPEAVGAIADRELQVDSAEVLDVAGSFTEPDGEALEYAAASSDPARVAVSIAGSALSVAGVAKGGATVTVTARDPHGLAAELAFEVTVPNRGPEAVGTVAGREVHVGDSAEIDAAAHFADPDGDALAYVAVSSDPARVAVAVRGGAVTVRGVSVGSATVTLTARDPEGLSAEQSFRVAVPNRAPGPHGAIPAQAAHVGDTIRVNVAAYFAEPDGEALIYTAESSSAATAAVGITGGVVTVVAVAVGSATVTVTARDPHRLAAEQTFGVTVPNRGPEAVGAIPDREVHVGDSAKIDAAAHFTEPDGEALTYAAASSDPGRVAVAVAATGVAGGAIMTIRGVSAGSATVTVTARDPHGAGAEQVFRVTVPNRAPEAVGAIGARALAVDRSLSVDVSPYFTDPDGDELTYTSASSNAARVTVSVSGADVTVTGEQAGTATITVTAADPGGLSASQRFEVSVTRSAAPSDLIVLSPAAAPDRLGPGETLTLRAVVRNRGAGSASSGTTLRYFLSADETIGANTQVGTDVVALLGQFRSSAHSLEVTAPSEFGTYFFRACVDAVANESSSSNNCSGAVDIVVAPPNRPPRATGTIADRTVLAGGEVTVDAARYFADPDDDDLDYAASSSDPAVATATVSGSNVRVVGREAGAATITVRATDPGGLSATRSFRVEVEDAPNRAPYLINGLSDLVNIPPGSSYAAYLPDVFADPDQDPLEWTTSSSNSAAVTSWISNDSIVISAVGAGSSTVTVTATDPEGLSATDEFDVEVAPPHFDMELLFTDHVTEAQRELIRAGRDTWESALEGTELNDIPFSGSAACFGLVASNLYEVDDHIVFVDVDTIDGEGKVGARATYCYTRRSDGTPIVSAAVFDEADIDTVVANDRLTELAIHEFAHGLGFHISYWRTNELIDEGDDPHFKGTLAIGAFDAAGGTAYTGKKVPVSSDFSHWRESVFYREVMSPRFHLRNASPLSAITLQAMADVGYVVDLSFAEDYELPDSAAPGPSADASGPILDLTDDMVRGPVIVVDSDGSVVRVHPAPPGSEPAPFPLRTVRADRVVRPDRTGRPEREPPGIWVRYPPRR